MRTPHDAATDFRPCDFSTSKTSTGVPAMQTEPLTSPQADPIATLAARVERLEHSAAAGRRWRFAFVVLAVVVVGMGAAGEAVRDVEFGTVKAKRFEVVGSNGFGVASLSVAKNDDGAEEGALVVVSGQDKKTPFKATFVRPGQDLKILDKSNE